ncbi:retrovirus-related pol polyprotein from transposon TNT 1-94 [Tanacetum coccineum]
MALSYQNPFYFKQAQQKQQCLYNGKVLLEKHDPPVVYDSEETLPLAQECRSKMKQLNKEIKPANYAKINQLSKVFISQKTKSREESYFSNTSKMASVSKSIPIPNEEFLDDTSPKADESLAKHKSLEYEIERLLKAIVSQDIMSIVQTYNNMQQKIERSPAQLGDFKGKCQDTPYVSDTFDPLSQKLENEKVELEINPSKIYKEDKFVPINQARASVRTNPITVSQPHVITKKDVNSDLNGLSSTRVDNIAKTRRPQPMSNTKNDSDKHSANVSKTANKRKHKPKGKKPKNIGSKEKLASLKPTKPRTCLRWSPTGRMFDLKGKIITSSESECQYDNSKGSSNLFMVRRLEMLKAYERKSKASHKFRLEVSGNGLGHNLFSVGQFCDSDLEVAFRRNTCFVRNLEGVDLFKGNRTTNLYTINLHEMASASPIYLMACATSTKSWLWHQRLSHLNFDTINDLAKNDLVTGLLKFKYHKEHLCPYYEQGKSKKASHPPKPVPKF